MTDTATIPDAPHWRPVEVHAVVPPVSKLAATPVARQVQQLHNVANKAYGAAAKHRTAATASALDAARTSDRQDRARARLAGEPEPTEGVAVAALEARVEHLHDEASTWAEAALLAHEELAEAIAGEPGETWAADLEARRAAGVARVLRALDELRDVGAELQAVIDETAWRDQAVAHLRGDLNARSSATVSWPQNYGGPEFELAYNSNHGTVSHLTETLRDQFVSGACLAPRRRISQ